MKQDNRFSPCDNYDSLEEMCSKCFGVSRSFLKKNLSRKLLLKKIKAQREITLPFEITNSKLVNPTYQGREIPIIFEDEDIVVLNKPEGIHSYPLTYCEHDNCLSFLREKNYFLPASGRKFGLINRLDNVTSGLLIIFKDQETRDEVRDNFLSIATLKEYIAVVEGVIEEDQSLDQLIKPVGPKGSRMMVAAEGSRAKLELKPLAVTKGYTLVKIVLETGLRHQVRVQLSDIGFPIVGDELYGAKKADRVFLHCYRYILDWNGKQFDYCAKEANLFELFFDLDSIL